MRDVPERVVRDGFDWLGYGHADAPLWFVGRDTRFGLARCTRVADHRQYLDLRRGFDRFEGYVEVWEEVLGRPVHGGEGGLSPRWWAAAFTMGYQGTALTDLTTDERETRIRDYTYQNPRIGCRDGDTVVADVYPLPTTELEDADRYDHVWESVDEYRRDVHPDRLDRFADAIRDSDSVECIVAHAPSEDFANPIVDRFDATHETTWPGVRTDHAFDTYRLGGDASQTLLVDAPPFESGFVSYETIQLAAERARELTRDLATEEQAVV